MSALEWVGLLEDAGYAAQPYRLGRHAYVAVPVEWRHVLRLGSDLAACAALRSYDNGEDAEAVATAAAKVAGMMREGRQGVDARTDDIIYWPTLAWPEEATT